MGSEEWSNASVGVSYSLLSVWDLLRMDKMIYN